MKRRTAQMPIAPASETQYIRDWVKCNKPDLWRRRMKSARQSASAVPPRTPDRRPTTHRGGTVANKADSKQTAQIPPLAGPQAVSRVVDDIVELLAHAILTDVMADPGGATR